MADGVVQLATDGPGKKIDTSELMRADGTVIERQRAVIGDATDPLALLRVNPAGMPVLDLAELIYEARKQTALLRGIYSQLASASGQHNTFDEILEF